MSGARLFAMPELRPIRIHAGAVGMEIPDEDLLVSPQHRMLVTEAVAQSLFDTSEAFVMMKDLINGYSIMGDQ